MDNIVAILAIVSPLAALIFGYFSFNNSRKKMEHEEASERTTLIVKLENINDNVKDVKSDVKGIRDDILALTERVAKVEASCSSAHKRIDGLTTK